MVMGRCEQSRPRSAERDNPGQGASKQVLSVATVCTMGATASATVGLLGFSIYNYDQPNRRLLREVDPFIVTKHRPQECLAEHEATIKLLHSESSYASVSHHDSSHRTLIYGRC